MIQNRNGEFYAVGAAGFHGDVQVIEAEAQAVLCGLWLVVDVGISSVEVESNCLGLINMLELDSLPLSYIRLLCEEIKDVVLLVGVVFCFYP